MREAGRETREARDAKATEDVMRERDREYWAEHERGKRLFWGIALIALGTIAALDYLGVVPFRLGAHTWPVIVIVFGVARTVTAWSARKLGGGVSMTLLGCWFWAVTNHWHGFEWFNSWPLALVASGAGMVVHALAMPFYRRRRDDSVVNVDVH
jgi:hypothetical protein